MNTVIQPCEASKSVLKSICKTGQPAFMYGVKKKKGFGKMRWFIMRGDWWFSDPSEKEVVRKFALIFSEYGFK